MEYGGAPTPISKKRKVLRAFKSVPDIARDPKKDEADRVGVGSFSPLYFNLNLN